MVHLLIVLDLSDSSGRYVTMACDPCVSFSLFQKLSYSLVFLLLELFLHPMQEYCAVYSQVIANGTFRLLTPKLTLRPTYADQFSLAFPADELIL